MSKNLLLRFSAPKPGLLIFYSAMILSVCCCVCYYFRCSAYSAIWAPYNHFVGANKMVLTSCPSINK